MKAEKAYIVSFGDSGKYSVQFPGSREEFEKSEEFRHIKEEVCGYVKSHLPAAACKYVVTPTVEDITGPDEVYPVLDADTLGRLKHEALRQIEVKLGYSALNANARFDETGQ